MSILTLADCDIYYDVVDLTLPWLREPQTILLHHGLGSTSGIWAEWLPILASHYRLVRFDMRGHGRSGVPAPESRVTIDSLTSDALAIADATHTGQFHVV